MIKIQLEIGKSDIIKWNPNHEIFFSVKSCYNYLREEDLEDNMEEDGKKRPEENLEDQHPIKVECLWLEVNDK